MEEFQTPWDPTDSKSFEELISHDPVGMARVQNYTDLIASTESNVFPATGSERWDQWLSRENRFEKGNIPGLERDLAFFTHVLQGALLTDLGSGKSSFMRSFAKRFGVKLLLEIDLFYENKDKAQPDHVRIISVRDDMLKTVARMPNDCSNFTINAIGFELITNRNYHAALAEELVRATKPGGIIFGWGSDVFFYLKDNPEVSLRPLESTHALDYAIFQKRS